MTQFTNVESDALAALQAAYNADPNFVSSNTDTGTATVTINEKSGVAVFSRNITNNTFFTMTINNSLIVAGSVVMLTLKYTPSTTEVPFIAYYTTTTGVLTVTIGAYDTGVDVTNDMSVGFRIVA